jgi:hypothetical protein
VIAGKFRQCGSGNAHVFDLRFSRHRLAALKQRVAAKGYDDTHS